MVHARLDDLYSATRTKKVVGEVGFRVFIQKIAQPIDLRLVNVGDNMNRHCWF